MLLDNNEVIVKGKFVKIIQFREEWDIDVDDPELVINKIKSYGIKANIFSFQQRLPESKPKFNYYMEWDNIAALPITNYDDWFKRVLHQHPRNKMRIAQKKGVEVNIFEFNDETLKDIISIYHENPLRQGAPNIDYNIDFETAKKANSTFLDRATFIGAYYKNELIGFIKLVSAGKYTRIMGILGKIAHRDKASMNLLMAKAVEICDTEKTPYLVYAKFDYGKIGSETLRNFKLYFGYESIVLPRYYIPLNLRGKMILKLRLHQGIVGFLPRRLIRVLLNLRRKYYTWRYSHKQ